MPACGVHSMMEWPAPRPRPCRNRFLGGYPLTPRCKEKDLEFGISILDDFVYRLTSWEVVSSAICPKYALRTAATSTCMLMVILALDGTQMMNLSSKEAQPAIQSCKFPCCMTF